MSTQESRRATSTPKRTTGSTLASWLIIAAILGFAGGGFIGVQTGGGPTANAGEGSPSDDPPENTDDTQPDETSPPETSEPETGVAFTASSNEVTDTDRVTLAGSLTPPEPDVELILWRSVDGGEWTIFPSPDNPVDPFVTDADGNFERYVQNLRAGDNTFKLVHSDDESVESEPVTIVVSD
jgi:hypothetical protein